MPTDLAGFAIWIIILVTAAGFVWGIIKWWEIPVSPVVVKYVGGFFLAVLAILLILFLVNLSGQGGGVRLFRQ
jgi:hypothetical protein